MRRAPSAAAPTVPRSARRLACASIALCVATFAATFAGTTARAESADTAGRERYVRDWIAVPLLASPAQDSRPLQNGLVTGTALTLLEPQESNGFSHVRTRNGSEGWIGTRYLTAEPIARVQLDKANAELEELRKLKTQLADLPADVRTAAQQLIEVRAQNAELRKALDDAQKTPSEAAALSADNTRLKGENDSLRQQLADRDTEIRLLRDDSGQKQFRAGALAVVAGMLVVLAVRRLWPKKRSEWS